MSHPLPPADIADRPLPLISFSEPLFRLHDAQYSPLYFGRAGRYRFDAPAGEYGVLYAASDIHCAFIETFAHATGTGIVSLNELRRRAVVRIELLRSLRLVDLTGPGLARLGADNRLCTGEYTTAQKWSSAIHEHPERPDGIYYRARHDPSRVAVALFDRVREFLTTTPLGTLADSQHVGTLADVLDTYRFGLVGT